jgi:hypothetical protein
MNLNKSELFKGHLRKAKVIRPLTHPPIRVKFKFKFYILASVPGRNMTAD